MKGSGVRTRFAPSPTGIPHIGNMRTALFEWLFARHHKGQFILRIEDTDRERYVEGSVEAILDGLRWLGLDWDEGPEVGGPCGPYFQSQRLEIYQKYAYQLLESGKAYRCFCTPERLEQLRKEQQVKKLPPGYDRHCRYLSPKERSALEKKGLPSVIRIAMPLEGTLTFTDLIRGEITFECRVFQDWVAIKSDGYPTYNFANVIDDHLMGITHVIRGEEFISSTPIHIYTYHLFGWDPPQFAHLPLILGPDRSKLSKRHGATSLQEYRDQGFLPEALVNYLALLGWAPGAGEQREIFSLQELIERFDLDGVSPNPAIFDVTKLEWMNGEYIRQLSPQELAQRVLPFLQKAGLLPDPLPPDQRAYLEQVVILEQERLKRLAEAPSLMEFFFKEDITYDPKAVDKWLRESHIPDFLGHVEKNLADLQNWEVKAIEEAIRGAAFGLSGGKVTHPVRVAVTGRTVGPGLFEIIAVLGKERTLKRLRYVREHLLRNPR